MRRLALLFLLLLLGLAQAQTLTANETLTLEEALESVTTQESVVAAKIELVAAQDNYARAQADPLALRLTKTEAEQRLRLAEVSLKHTIAQTVGDITAAYGAVLVARVRHDVAQTALALNERLVEGARIRLRNGSATELGVREAETALEEARAELRAAERDLTLALDALQSLIDERVNAGGLEAVPDRYLADVPPVLAALSAIEGHPELRAARQERILAELTFDSLSPVYSSPAEISRARVAFETARAAEQRAARSFHLAALDLVGQATTAREAYQVLQTAQANAQERLAYQQTRMEAGLLSEVEFLQAQLDAGLAELAALEARIGFLNALQALRTGTMVGLDDGIDMEATSGQ